LIATLRGQAIGRGKDFIVIEVNGVGFRVTVPQRLLLTWGTAGTEIQVHTHLHVRENDLSLYGCETEEELEILRLLLSVRGVGPKVAMSVLSDLSPDELRQVIVSEDHAALAQISGIGPKTAKTLLFHLKDKFPEKEFYAPSARDVDRWHSDVIAALTSLGYSLSEASAAIKSVPVETEEFEEKLRLALRYFAR
jgi:holliday junction DNA helicase RuvA